MSATSENIGPVLAPFLRAAISDLKGSASPLDNSEQIRAQYNNAMDSLEEVATQLEQLAAAAPLMQEIMALRADFDWLDKHTDAGIHTRTDQVSLFIRGDAPSEFRAWYDSGSETISLREIVAMCRKAAAE